MKRRKRRRVTVAVRLPFAECDRTNAVWCIDFKGKFRTRDGKWCHVLTLEDAYSRFLLRAESLLDPGGDNVGFWMAHFRSSDCLKRFDPTMVPPSLRQALVVSGCWIAGKGSEDAAARPRSMAGRLRRSAATRSSRDVRARGRVSTIASGLSTQAHRSARHVARRTRHELQARRTETAPAAASRTQDPHLERALVRVPVLGAVDDERFDDATRIEQPRSTRCVWLP
jgi:hypothetical protein